MPDGSQLAIQATIKRATLAAHKAIEQLDAAALRQLEDIYKQAAADIASRIAVHSGPDGNLALSELRSALAQIQGELGHLADMRDRLLNTSLQQAADLGVRPLTQTAAAAITPDAGMRVATEALEFVRSFVAEDGLQLSDRIWRIDRGARDKVVNAIEQAVIQGHSAQQAARELLGRGQGVPGELQDKINAANASALGRTAGDALTKGAGAPMDNAMRLMRTEINRAHGEAYMKGGEETRGFAAWKYLLSPAHPAPDICDLLSTQNLYGLGPGCYPDRARTPWPAHPNTLSFIVMKFENEVTDEDRAGKETPLQALGRLKPAQQIGVLGKHKHQAFKDGVLRQGMIRAPWKAVALRVGQLKIRTPLVREVRPPIGRAPAVPGAVAAIQGRLAAAVDMPRITEKQIKSIGAGLDAVMGPHGIKVGLLTWAPVGKKYSAAYIHRISGHTPGENDRLVFQRTYVARAAAKEADTNKKFDAQRDRQISRLEEMISTERSETSRRILETRLDTVKASTRWGVSSDAKDPLFSVAAHEAGHAVYFRNQEIGRTWVEALQQERVSRIDMVRVSEYGATSVTELWAEVTALIAESRRAEVPEKILRAYDAAIKKVK